LLLGLGLEKLGVDGNDVGVLELADGGHLIGSLGLGLLSGLGEELAEHDVLVFGALGDIDFQINVVVDAALRAAGVDELGVPLVVDEAVVDECLDLEEGGRLQRRVSDPPVDVGVV